VFTACPAVKSCGWMEILEVQRALARCYREVGNFLLFFTVVGRFLSDTVSW